MKTLVIIPTYNERENISAMAETLFSMLPSLNILVVDDNSPDKTYDLVSELAATKYPNLHLLHRKAKEGLGRAYIAGFKWALEQGYDLIVEMDADFSHRPEDLKKILDNIGDADFCVGSRWVDGGGTRNWSWLRKLISLGGSFYSRLILGYPLNDWTGGFNFWRANVLKSIELDNIQSNGYSFQIELKYRALRKGFKGVELPIIFEERRAGQSKMSFKIVAEALFKVWSIKSIKL